MDPLMIPFHFLFVCFWLIRVILCLAVCFWLIRKQATLKSIWRTLASFPGTIVKWFFFPTK
ncbi:hypothetical protein V6Z11_D10G168200 [Gossypium hirsutum]